MYLTIGEADGHIEEKNGSKYLVFDSTDENREVLEIKTLSYVLENEIKKIKKVTMVRISWKLNSMQVIICH